MPIPSASPAPRAGGEGVLGQALLQVERGEHSAPGMILLGHGPAKHRRQALRRLLGQRAPIGLEHLVGEDDHRLHDAIQPLRRPALPPGSPRRGGPHTGR